jgi:endonuclease/exonuclease/phosphatase (EEP) superfamily protein YafD
MAPALRDGAATAATAAPRVRHDARVGRIVSILVGIFALLVLVSALDTLLWPGPPAAFFRPQLTVALVLAAGLAAVARRHRAALAGAAVAVLGGVLVVPALLTRQAEPPPAGSPSVRLLALNLWYENDDVEAVAALIERERPDVVALTELTPFWDEALAPTLEAYPSRAAEPREGSIGIGLFGRELLADPEVVRLFDDERASVEGVLSLPDGREAPLLVVHPASGLEPGSVELHRSSLAAIARWADERGPLASVCGDLNATPWLRSLRRTLARADLRAALPGGPLGGSWPRLPRPLRVPIDGCLVGAGVRARAELGPDVGSDHLPVLVELG